MIKSESAAALPHGTRPQKRRKRFIHIVGPEVGEKDDQQGQLFADGSKYQSRVVSMSAKPPNNVDDIVDGLVM